MLDGSPEAKFSSLETETKNWSRTCTFQSFNPGSRPNSDYYRQSFEMVACTQPQLRAAAKLKCLT